MSEWMSMGSAPKTGESVILMTAERILQASFHFGEWHEEKEWAKHELSSPSPKFTPIAWRALK